MLTSKSIWAVVYLWKILERFYFLINSSLGIVVNTDCDFFIVVVCIVCTFLLIVSVCNYALCMLFIDILVLVAY